MNQSPEEPSDRMRDIVREALKLDRTDVTNVLRQHADRLRQSVLADRMPRIMASLQSGQPDAREMLQAYSDMIRYHSLIATADLIKTHG